MSDFSLENVLLARDHRRRIDRNPTLLERLTRDDPLHQRRPAVVVLLQLAHEPTHRRRVVVIDAAPQRIRQELVGDRPDELIALAQQRLPKPPQAVNGGPIELDRRVDGRAAVGLAPAPDRIEVLHREPQPARNGDIPTAEALIVAGVDINDLSADGTHVLPFAIVNGQDAFAMFLLEQGADPNGTMGGVHALHAAAGSAGTWLGDWYRRHGRGGVYGSFFRRGRNPASRLTLVKELLARGAAPNVRTTSSAMIMSYIGYPRKGAFETYACGTGDLRGVTPLWVAAWGSNGAGGQVFSVRASRSESSLDIIRALLEAGADQHLTTGRRRSWRRRDWGVRRSHLGNRVGVRSPGAEETVRFLLEQGADINAVNEADFTALHGAAFRGLNEVVQFLVESGSDIDARDFRGRTAYRIAEGAKQSFQFQSWPETADLLKSLGANTRLGIPGTVHERLRDIPADATGQP